MCDVRGCGNCMQHQYVPTHVCPFHPPRFVFGLKAWPLPGGILCGIVRRKQGPLSL